MNPDKNLLITFLLIMAGIINAQNPFSGISGEFVLDSKSPEVTVSSPNGGETYFHQAPLLVTWSAIDESFGNTPVSIEISTDAGVSYTQVASSLSNNGSAYKD